MQIYKDLTSAANQEFEKLLNTKHGFYLQEGAASAGMMVLSIHLFPFFVHYFRGNIDKEQLTMWKNQIDQCFREKIKAKL